MECFGCGSLLRGLFSLVNVSHYEDDLCLLSHFILKSMYVWGVPESQAVAHVLKGKDTAPTFGS